MSLKLYNTLTRKKETFQPLAEGKAGIYVCGITAYDTCHVGHARSAVVFDVIARYLRYRGYQVTYVKNFTDVDDKIIDKANAEKTDIFAIAERYIREHNEDMDALGVARPDRTPRATEHIEGMIALVSKLIANNLAYVIGGDVYFAVEKFKNYGKLSGRTLEDMLAGARVDVNEKKINPMDFALWKASKEGEPWWESPWGHGRPGWHIECSVMSQKFLGDTFDIHGGGEDLIFPHHENEIAIAEALTGKPLAKYWLHSELLLVDGKMMSAEAGNVVTLNDLILRGFTPREVRFMLLSVHYRKPLNFSFKRLINVRTALRRIDEFTCKLLCLPPGKPHPEIAAFVSTMTEQFFEAMDDDLNVSKGMGAIYKFIKTVGPILHVNHLDHDQKKYILESFNKINQILQIFRLKGCPLAPGVGTLIARREKARAEKDWQAADDVRDELLRQGIQIIDTATGPVWNPLDEKKE